MGKYVVPEIWKPVPILGFESRFQISTNGRVRSNDTFSCYLRKGIIRKQRLGKDGRWYVTLRIGNWRKNKVVSKTVQVHRLVAMAFIPNPLNLPEVNHKDENPQNNFVLNLEWCDHAYNCRYGTRVARVTSKIMKPVCQLTKEGELIKIWESGVTAESYYRPNKKRCGSISNCCTGKHKTAFGYKWKYMEDM